MNSRLDQDVLLLVFAGLMVLVALHMLLSSNGDEEDGRRFEGRARLLAAGVAGAAVGFLTGLLGVGGGFLIVPALVLTLHLPMAVAVGTSLVVIVATPLPGSWPTSQELTSTG